MSIAEIFTPLDLAAFGYFLVIIGIYRTLCGPRALEGRSMPGAVQAQRVRWMPTWRRVRTIAPSTSSC